jgi:hypothetical protein
MEIKASGFPRMKRLRWARSASLIHGRVKSATPDKKVREESVVEGKVV